MERERDAILSTILQEEPYRDLLMENKGIVGEDYELMPEPNSWNPGVDGDLGRLATDAYEDHDTRQDVTSLHGRYDYHKNRRRPKHPFTRKTISYSSRAEARPSTRVGVPLSRMRRLIPGLWAASCPELMTVDCLTA